MSEAFSPRPERFLAMVADDRPHLFDGGFGTELHYRGVSVTRCFDELNLSRPELVSKVHELFLEAGAEILETNSYGASRTKLAPFGFEDRVGEINRAAAVLARRAAGDRALVAGAMGPLGVRIEPFGPTSTGGGPGLLQGAGRSPPGGRGGPLRSGDLRLHRRAGRGHSRSRRRPGTFPSWPR